MGLAASQGRLLLLTARKSDLEFRAQTISQRRLMLAQELETIASEYARKTANRNMKIALTVSTEQGNGNARREVDLTWNNLHNLDQQNGNPVYRVKNAFGEIAVPSAGDLPAGASDAGNGKYKFDGEIYIINPELGNGGSNNNFQEGLRNGTYYIEHFTTTGRNGEVEENGEWQSVPWSGMSEISDNYYTEDDPDAQAKYDVATARVQAQDKKLETDQKQIETQHKAVETEVESVNKVIQSNIEGSFKMFS